MSLGDLRVHIIILFLHSEHRDRWYYCTFGWPTRRKVDYYNNMFAESVFYLVLSKFRSPYGGGINLTLLLFLSPCQSLIPRLRFHATIGNIIILYIYTDLADDTRGLMSKFYDAIRYVGTDDLRSLCEYGFTRIYYYFNRTMQSHNYLQS